MGKDCNSKSNDGNITIIFIILLQWNPINMVTNGQKKIGRNNELTVLMRVSLQEMFGRFCQATKKKWP